MVTDAGNAQTQKKVVELLEDMRTCMLTTIGSDGSLQSRPMTVQDVENDADLWFFIDNTSEQADLIRANAKVNAAFASRSSWVSVAGDAEVVVDRARIDRYWSKMMDAWFPEGKDDPKVALVHLKSASAEYWDSPGGTVTTLVSLVKAKVAGERMEGDNEAVDLPTEQA